MPQLSHAEMHRLDKLLRIGKMKPIVAWRELKKSREIAAKKAPKGQKLKAKKLSLSTVYSFSNGQTHIRGRVEKRGRKDALTKQDVRTLLQARRRLIL